MIRPPPFQLVSSKWSPPSLCCNQHSLSTGFGHGHLAKRKTELSWEDEGDSGEFFRPIPWKVLHNLSNMAKVVMKMVFFSQKDTIMNLQDHHNWQVSYRTEGGCRNYWDNMCSSTEGSLASPPGFDWFSPYLPLHRSLQSQIPHFNLEPPHYLILKWPEHLTNWHFMFYNRILILPASKISWS